MTTNVPGGPLELDVALAASANREKVLAKEAAKRRGPRTLVWCSECGGPLDGRQRVVCSARCRDARYCRLHPDPYAAKEARKVERRRAKRREGDVS